MCLFTSSTLVKLKITFFWVCNIPVLLHANHFSCFWLASWVLVAYKLSKFTDAWEVNACFASVHITFCKVWRSVWLHHNIYKIAGNWLCFFSAFLWTERLLFATLSLTLSKNHKLFNSTLCNVFLAPDLSKHYPKLAIKLGPSCSLVGSQSEHNVPLLLSPKGFASDIISLVIGFIHYTYVYFLVIMKWGSNEVSYTQIKSLLSIEKSLIDAWGQLLSYLTLSVN